MRFRQSSSQEVLFDPVSLGNFSFQITGGGEEAQGLFILGFHTRLVAARQKPLLEFLCMRTAKSQTAISISIAALCIVMLLYSPLCSLSCALNSCASSKAEAAKSGEQLGHCHHSEEPQEQSSTPQKILRSRLRIRATALLTSLRLGFFLIEYKCGAAPGLATCVG